MIDESILKNEERAVFALRQLYRSHGYLPFKMSKFEELEYYIRNKDFLISDRFITFNDLSGKLLALKPDVTLSIVKSREPSEGSTQKVYYNESIYRAAVRTLCREAKSCGVPLEYNLLGLNTGRHYPQRAFWEEAAVVGNKVILGWDAHQSYGLTIPDTEARADATLRELGLTRIDTLTLIKPRR